MNWISDPSYLPYLDTWAEWLMAPDGLPKTEDGGFQHIVFNDVNPGELWDDTLMMSVLPLAKIGLLLNRPHYVEEAKRQFLIHIKYLFDKKTGLWFHGWDFHRPPQLRRSLVGARQLLGDDRHPRDHRTARSGARRCVPHLPDRYAGRAGAAHWPPRRTAKPACGIP